MWFVAIFSVILNLVFPLLILYWILVQLKARFVWREFEQLLIEFLRSWGKTLNWSFLFILPGIWKWLCYTFVPFVVLFSKKYERGEVDALEQSSSVFRTSWGKTLIFVIVFSIAIPLMITSLFDGYREIWTTPVKTSLLGLGEYVLMILSSLVSLQIFQKASVEVKDELVF